SSNEDTAGIDSAGCSRQRALGGVTDDRPLEFHTTDRDQPPLNPTEPQADDESDGSLSLFPGAALTDDQKSQVERVKEANDIVDVVGDYVTLRPAGPTFKG